ncbi:MAG: Shikimate kinase [Bacteroidetes bacterium]|nr:Shikimate kinase [Bacteroidota bacterium]
MKNPEHIFFCGFMGCGKSTHGKKMAELLKMPFVDLDKFIEKKNQQTIQNIFTNLGEAEFRLLETRYLKELIELNPNKLIALGGGTVCFNNNLQLVKNNGLLVYLEMPVKALVVRLGQSKQERPLIKNLSSVQLETFIENKLIERNEFYKQAHLIVDGISLNYNKLQSQLLEFQK